MNVLDDDESSRDRPILDRIDDDGCDGSEIQDEDNPWLSDSEKNHGQDLK